jgi:hypothetical protein
MRRRKGDGNHSLPKNNLTQDSEGNEEHRYPVKGSNKTKINNTKNPTKPKRTLKEEVLQVITENFMKMLLDTINQNVQRGTQEIPRHQK